MQGQIRIRKRCSNRIRIPGTLILTPRIGMWKIRRKCCIMRSRFPLCWRKIFSESWGEIFSYPKRCHLFESMDNLMKRKKWISASMQFMTWDKIHNNFKFTVSIIFKIFIISFKICWFPTLSWTIDGKLSFSNDWR